MLFFKITTSTESFLETYTMQTIFHNLNEKGKTEPRGNFPALNTFMSREIVYINSLKMSLVDLEIYEKTY